MVAMRFSTVFPLMLAIFCLTGCNCGPRDGGDLDDAGSPPGQTPAKDTVSCGDLIGTYDAANGTWGFYPVGDTYGTNSFAVWEVEEIPGQPGSYRFVSNGEPVTATVPAKDWKVPDLVWGAIRLALDGNDPHKFTDQDQFYLWYLPYVPGQSWQSLFGAKNDGTCPGSINRVNGRLTCIKTNQLDELVGTLKSGKPYLFRLSMFIPLGSADHNRIQSCFQTIKTY